ncbi:uroporphyrinogen-III C-methyltransferase [Agitococcus lubricus]|uniref:Uncharacterized protein HemX n=1 Tax=Agitococcus lubricus TaxID=1077255 RepID=A0A2T5J3A8_9GAMM|nr:uroporphyrinogen-III C-methyltransferase [Agitococcus lubricus]PTQ91072.1 uncharacterized protein HemX [Agitococcus lubricus]
MSQTRQPIHVFPKITLKLGVWGRFGLVLAIITAIACYILYDNGVRYKNREKRHYTEVMQHITQLTQQQQHLMDENAAFKKHIANLQQQLDQFERGLNPQQQQQWRLKQVARYLQLADQHLLLQADIPSAQQLLEVADNLLSEQPDRQLLALREAIAADKLALTTAEQVDKAGISLRLDALKKQVNTVLPTITQAVAQQGTLQSPPAEQGAWAKAWTALQKLVTIRHYDQAVKPLLPEDQRWLLQQQVYLALSQAQLALWSGQDTRYQQSLAEVEQLLQDYQQLNPYYQAIVSETKQLKTIDLQVTIPHLTQSQQVLASLLNQEPMQVTQP